MGLFLQCLILHSRVKGIPTDYDEWASDPRLQHCPKSSEDGDIFNVHAEEGDRRIFSPQIWPAKAKHTVALFLKTFC
jgi:hypothetical protein